jgi:hypothetical protein
VQIGRRLALEVDIEKGQGFGKRQCLRIVLAQAENRPLPLRRRLRARIGKSAGPGARRDQAGKDEGKQQMFNKDH